MAYIEWIRQIGSSELDYSEGVAIDNNGNIYITGDFIDDNIYTAGGFTEDSLSSVNQSRVDAWITKYNTDGDLIWTKQIDSSEWDYSNGVATDDNGNVYITGSTLGSLGGVNQGGNDAWVAKYNTDGDLIWTKQIGSSESDYSRGITTDNNSNIYITGSTSGSLGGVNQGRSDAWVAKYNTDGDLIWTKQIGSSEWDYSNGVVTDDNRNIYITGGTFGSLGGVNQGGDDVWLSKISQSHISINRFQNIVSPSAYLFAGPEESQNIRENFSNFIEEGQAFKVAVESDDNLIRMNRFQNSNVPGAYLYVGEEESQNIRKNFPNFIEEGIAFYVYPDSADVGVNFYRFQNLDVPGTYIFVDSSERLNILDNYPNFVEEGIAFEVEV